jgi:primary-amine oxidase
MMVDGLENSVHEVNSEAVPLGPANPHGNAWVAKRTLLARESAAQRLVDPLAGRYWVVTNPGVTNSLGQPVGYKLVPGENVGTFAHPDSSIARRAGFMTRHLWVTRYDPAELFAAGDYPNQHPGGAGLPAFVTADRSLERANVVLWYSVGSHHISRPEEWPVMPVGYAGFQLKPAGFFVGSPALDVPATARNGHNGGHCH